MHRSSSTRVARAHRHRGTHARSAPGSRPPGRRPVPGRRRETTHYECQGAPGPSVRCSVGVDWQCHRD
ncbi:hypothetical protein G6F68_021131 [Rhizopus microsporus]|nr:hypothetical protein G6F68_021131 [Rhizopus microsporus]